MMLPTHGLANQQNSKNMATEKHKIATVTAGAAEEASFLQMNYYTPGWQNERKTPVQDGGLKFEPNFYCSGSRGDGFSRTQSKEADGLLLNPSGGVCQKDKRRFSRTSGTSSRTRTDDLSV